MKEKIISISFVSFICIFFLLNIFIKDINISESERRKLNQLPEVSIKNIMDNTFMEEFDKYTLDQFPFRNTFRSIKANVNYKLFQRLENNNIYIKDNYIFKSEYPTNIKSINNFINKINKIGTNFTKENNVYYAIIPDKNYYLNDSKYLNINYELLYGMIKKINYKYIELRDVLNLSDYYYTDTHWKQVNLSKVIDRLSENMNFKVNATYEEKCINDFYGVYYGQAALNTKPDKLCYLINDTILNSEVYYLEDSKNTDVYIENNLNNLDKYDIFLDGASSYIEITNKNNNNGRELIIFRDSFTSSLAPLLIDAYSKITLIDIRYISSSIYLDKLNFSNQDILFLYSTLIVNNSGSLKE